MPEEDKAEERMNIFSQISLKFDVITFHMPQGVLRNFRSCRGVPLNHLPMVYCLSINVLTRGSHVAILKKTYITYVSKHCYHLSKLWQATCCIHCWLLISLSLRPFISSCVFPSPCVYRHESSPCSSHR